MSNFNNFFKIWNIQFRVSNCLKINYFGILINLISEIFRFRLINTGKP